MKTTPLAALAALILAAFCAVSPSPASAQNNADRTNLYVVAGVSVDETAANGATAQQQGFASAKRIGFERLVRRLTLPADVARVGMPQPDPATLETLAPSLDIENERRSGTHYLGRFTVRFNADAVRTALRQAGLPPIETRGPPVLIVAAGDASLSPDALAAWNAAWNEGGYGSELAPLSIAPASVTGGDWASLSQFAQSQGASSALIATLRIQGNTATATLHQVAAQGARDWSPVSAAIAGTDAASVRAALTTLAQQINGGVQNEWKARAGSPTTTAATGRSRISASALYSNERDWEKIKAALEGAASTVVSEIRIEAVARDGALVSFTFTGDRTQLATELQRRGVTLGDGANGPELRAVAAPAH